MIKPNTIFLDGRKIGTYKSVLTAGTGHIDFNGFEPYEPQLDENQQIVLEWLKEENTKNPELTIFGTLSVLFDESENRFMSLDVIDALNDLSNKQQADVFQSFSQWALEQEE